MYDQNVKVSREEKQCPKNKKTLSSGTAILYSALILLGLVLFVANVSLGMVVKVFMVVIAAPFILLALGFIWIVVKVSIKMTYSKARQGSRVN
jgi:hypothetical protein